MKTLVGLMLWLSVCPVYAVDCDAVERLGSWKGYLIPSWQSGRNVVGMGKLALYSAPDRACRVAGEAIPAGSRLDAYVDYKGFTSIMYSDPEGQLVTGWVVTRRLKPNGYGIGPKQ